MHPHGQLGARRCPRYKQRDPGGLTEVFASDGTPASASSRTTTWSRPVAANDFPKVLNEATVAIEDERFYKHKGVDYEGIIRAAVKNATAHKTVQGGSTLTMQLVRNLYTQDDTRSGIEGYKRKIREARLAQELEEEHSKEWVLGKYLNTVPYGTVGGQTAIGAGAAARLYFDKRVQDLTLREAAMLAGMPQAPSQYSPVGNPRARPGAPQRGPGQDGRARIDHARRRRGPRWRRASGCTWTATSRRPASATCSTTSSPS